jgi:hypothetical protein
MSLGTERRPAMEALPASVRRVTLVKDGCPVRLGGRRRKAKKSSPVTRIVRATARAEQRGAAKFLEEMDRENRRRRDGWMPEAPVIVFHAARAAIKKLKRGLPRRLRVFIPRP